jgi:hypothetical protein
MTYFYNSNTGGFANESPPAPQYFTYEIQLHLGQGWHAYGTLAAMNAAIKANNWPAPDASKSLLSGTSTVPSSAPVQAAKSAFSGIDAVGAFFNRLTEANTWLRIGEAALGIILIALALGKLTGADNYISKNLPKVIPV